MFLNRLRGIVVVSKLPLRYSQAYLSDKKPEKPATDVKTEKPKPEAGAAAAAAAAKDATTNKEAAGAKAATATKKGTGTTDSAAVKEGENSKNKKTDQKDGKDAAAVVETPPPPPPPPESKWTQEPVAVSPLIRLSRWVLLICGIFYGLGRQHTLAQREEKVREKEAEKKIIRDAQLAQEKIIRAENEAKALALLSK